MTEKDTTNVPSRHNQHDSTTTSSTSTIIVRTQAAFVNKLYKMLEDDSIRHLISWSDKGDLFSVSNHTVFSKVVLPQYFKHNNWQSFVRQLNMYGFHKVNDMIHSNLSSDNQTWEFKHPHFKRGNVDDLQSIKRKSTKPASTSSQRRPLLNSSSSTSSSTSSSSSNSSGFQIKSETDEDMYGSLYKHIVHIEDRLHHVTQSYEILKNETNSLRKIVFQQQKTFSEFTKLLSELLEAGVNNGIKDSKKEAIIKKLNMLQSLAKPDSLTSVSPKQQNHHIERQGPHGSGYPISSSSGRLLQSQQQQQTNYHYSLAVAHQSPDSNNSGNSHLDNKTSLVDDTVATNKRLGFGKESHLLNPEEPSGQNYKLFSKRRRTE